MGIRVESKQNKNNDFYQTSNNYKKLSILLLRVRSRNSETVSKIYIMTILKKATSI